jgi:hypothetical protein
MIVLMVSMAMGRVGMRHSRRGLRLMGMVVRMVVVVVGHGFCVLSGLFQVGSQDVDEFLGSARPHGVCVMRGIDNMFPDVAFHQLDGESPDGTTHRRGQLEDARALGFGLQGALYRLDLSLDAPHAGDQLGFIGDGMRQVRSLDRLGEYPILARLANVKADCFALPKGRSGPAAAQCVMALVRPPLKGASHPYTGRISTLEARGDHGKGCGARAQGLALEGLGRSGCERSDHHGCEKGSQCQPKTKCRPQQDRSGKSEHVDAPRRRYPTWRRNAGFASRDARPYQGIIVNNLLIC